MNKIFYLIIFGTLFGFSTVFVNHDAFGYSFVGITSNGVEIPITLESDDSENMDETGDGTSILDGLGVSLSIQNINTDGKIYYGNGIIGSQTDIRQYVGVGSNDDWAIAVDDDDSVEPLSISEFGSEYQYVNGQLIQIDNTLPNILSYSNSKKMSGTNSVNLSNGGIVISGTGIQIIKLNSYDDDILLRGTLNNTDVKIVTSPLDLTTLSMSGSNYIVAQTTPSKQITFSEDHFHYHTCRGGICRGGYNHPHQTWDMVSTVNVVVAEDSDFKGKYSTSESCRGKLKNNECHNIGPGYLTHGKCYSFCYRYHDHSFSASRTSDFTTKVVSDGIKITKQITTGSMATYASKTHTITSTHPWNERYHLTENFEHLTAISDNSYLVVTLNGGSATIKGENFDPDSDVFFKVSGLPPDIAYDVSKSGIVGTVGKTDSDGMISLLYDDVDFGVSASPGGILKTYPDSVAYLGDFGIGLIDMHNGESIPLSLGEDLVYVPQNYVRWVFPAPVEITNLKVDEIFLDYLNKDYAKNEALVIPVIPSADTIYATINGTDIEVLMRDVDVRTQIKQVQEKSSTTSDFSNDGTASVSSNISTSTFLTATHDGIAIANIDVKVGGSADFSMSSGYNGEFEEATNCKTNYSTPRLNKSCRTVNIPVNLSGISNIKSLTSAHRDQLVTALNNGQVSQITVDVDVITNMEYVKTFVIHTLDSAQASTTSTFNETRYSANNQVYVKYPLTSITENISVPVSVGDMIEFVIRVNLDAKGAPVPTSDDGKYSSYVKATTEFGGGVITVGMS